MANPNPRTDHLEATRFRSGTEAANAGRKGGKMSGEARREKRSQQDIARHLLEMPMEDRQLDTVEYLKGFKGMKMTAGEAALFVLLQKAIQEADGHAYTIVRDTAGEQPVQKVEVNSDVAAAEKSLADMIEEMDNAKADQ